MINTGLVTVYQPNSIAAEYKLTFAIVPPELAQEQYGKALNKLQNVMETNYDDDENIYLQPCFFVDSEGHHPTS